MNALRILIVAACLGTAGCFDFDKSYATYCDAGGCGVAGGAGGGGGGLGGGGGGSMGGGAGGGVAGGAGGGVGGGGGGAAGGGAGGGGIAVYDGGPPCPASNRPRLKCDPPLNLGLIGGVSYGWVSVNDQGLLVAMIRPTIPAVELRTLLPDGGGTTRQWLTNAVALGIGVAGNGQHWAVTWSEPGQLISCVSSRGDGGVSLIDAGMSVDEVSIAVSVQGGIGITARPASSAAGLMGASAGGCPDTMIAMAKPGYGTMLPSGVAATVLPNGTAATDFRFAAVEDFNGFSGTHGTYGLALDGGVDSAQHAQFGDPSYDVSAAMSGDGTALMISYTGQLEDGGWALKVKPMPTDYGPPDAVGREVMPETTVWGSSSCGATCFASLGVLKKSPVTLRASFVSADSVAADLGGGSWDVACARSLTPLNSIPTYAFGRLVVLYTDSTRNELYGCDLPAF